MRPRERLRLKVFERDNYLCTCGKLATCQHHIVHRGKASKKLIWREENMISLCWLCHQEANSKMVKLYHLDYLRETFGYVYVDQPWVGILGEA